MGPHHNIERRILLTDALSDIDHACIVASGSDSVKDYERPGSNRVQSLHDVILHVKREENIDDRTIYNFACRVGEIVAALEERREPLCVSQDFSHEQIDEFFLGRIATFASADLSERLSIAQKLAFAAARPSETLCASCSNFNNCPAAIRASTPIQLPFATTSAE
jgi:hypothetical protein